MCLDNISDAALARLRDRLVRAVIERDLQITDIHVGIVPKESLLEVTGEVVSDPLLNSAGNALHRRISIAVRMFSESENTGKEVIWGRIRYSVERDFSNFFPVPEEYGEEVKIEFNWEFDRETLEHGAAELRDCNRLHYVSVRPNNQLTEFVQCCSAVVEQWESS